jgi:predicted nuclease of predicted toxin-antitoxin system
MHAAEDDVVLERAAREDRVLISKDTDFGDLLAESGAASPSVILFRRSSGEPEIQFGLLNQCLNGLVEHLQNGCIVIIEPEKVRIRKLPIGE